MPDTLASLPVDWDALDALKFADEEALLEGLIRQGVLPGAIRDAAVRRGRELVVIARSRGRRPRSEINRADAPEFRRTVAASASEPKCHHSLALAATTGPKSKATLV